MPLTPQQVYAYARSAGFPASTARKMVAIAQRESSLNPGVTGTINAAKETSYGLWQINWKDDAIKALLRRNGITEPTMLFDPAVNAKAAYLLWGGNDNNLNIAWYINRYGNQYGYAEKYTANLNALPTEGVLEARYSGAGAGPGDGVIVAGGSGSGSGGDRGNAPNPMPGLPVPRKKPTITA